MADVRSLDLASANGQEDECWEWKECEEAGLEMHTWKCVSG